MCLYKIKNKPLKKMQSHYSKKSDVFCKNITFYVRMVNKLAEEDKNYYRKMCFEFKQNKHCVL